jgi:hypothetical protein
MRHVAAGVDEADVRVGQGGRELGQRVGRRQDLVRVAPEDERVLVAQRGRHDIGHGVAAPKQPGHGVVLPRVALAVQEPDADRVEVA